MNDLRLHYPFKVYDYGKRMGILEHSSYNWIAVFRPSEESYQPLLQAYKAIITNEPQYKFGVRVPRTVKEALELDKQNGNNYWLEALQTEIGQINFYETFQLVEDGIKLLGYKRIPYHFVFDVKFDGRHKARLVARGHRTTSPSDD